MTVNIQQSPYLPRQRNFPNDNAQALGVEIDKTYIDIAQRVNARTIGIYTVNFSTITGESWYLQGQPRRRQSLRQVYEFTTLANIDLGFKLDQTSGISLAYGEYFDAATGNWYGFIFASNVAIAGQRTFYFLNTASTTTDQIVLLAGAGAPAFTRGRIIVEWLSNIDTNS